jgi:hypothetical protein
MLSKTHLSPPMGIDRKGSRIRIIYALITLNIVFKTARDQGAIVKERVQHHLHHKIIRSVYDPYHTGKPDCIKFHIHKQSRSNARGSSRYNYRTTVDTDDSDQASQYVEEHYFKANYLLRACRAQAPSSFPRTSTRRDRYHDSTVSVISCSYFWTDKS